MMPSRPAAEVDVVSYIAIMVMLGVNGRVVLCWIVVCVVFCPVFYLLCGTGVVKLKSSVSSVGYTVL